MKETEKLKRENSQLTIKLGVIESLCKVYDDDDSPALKRIKAYLGIGKGTEE